MNLMIFILYHKSLYFSINLIKLESIWFLRIAFLWWTERGYIREKQDALLNDILTLIIDDANANGDRWNCLLGKWATATRQRARLSTVHSIYNRDA